MKSGAWDKFGGVPWVSDACSYSSRGPSCFGTTCGEIGSPSLLSEPSYDVVEVVVRDGDFLIGSDVQFAVRDCVEMLLHAGAIPAFEEHGPRVLIDVDRFRVGWV